MSYMSLLVLAPLVLLFLAVILLVGVYVWRDAKKRGMNAELWTLVALLAPSMIGLIIYLLVRGSCSDLQCPKCSAPVEERYVVCPGCGARLKAACRNCSAPVEPDWKVCPYCACELEPDAEVTPPVHKRDRTLGKILLVVILVPLIIIGAAVVGMISFGGSGSTNTIYYESKEHYLGGMADSGYSEELEEWLNGCGSDPEKPCAYALRYRTESGGEKVTQYLVYLPSGEAEDISVAVQTSFGLTNSVSVKFTDDGSGINRGYKLCSVSVRGDRYVRLRVYLNLGKLPCEISDFDGRLTPFELVSSDERELRGE